MNALVGCFHYAFTTIGDVLAYCRVEGSVRSSERSCYRPWHGSDALLCMARQALRAHIDVCFDAVGEILFRVFC